MTRRLGVVAAGLTLAIPSCSDRPSGSLVFQIALQPPPDDRAGAVLLQGDSAVVALAGDTITVHRARLAVRAIVLVPAASGECEPEEEEEGQCVELRSRPMLVDLPLGAGSKSVFTSRARADSYSVVEVAIGRPDRSRAESIRLEGSWSRSGLRREFVYVADVNEVQELDLTPPLDLRAGRTTRLTLRFDIAAWFRTPDRAALVDPSSANPGRPNETLVRDNIRMSFTARSSP